MLISKPTMFDHYYPFIFQEILLVHYLMSLNSYQKLHLYLSMSLMESRKFGLPSEQPITCILICSMTLLKKSNKIGEKPFLGTHYVPLATKLLNMATSVSEIPTFQLGIWVKMLWSLFSTISKFSGNL